MQPPRRFILIWCAAVLGLVVLISGFNAIVDPYDVFGSPRIAGFNKFKPAAKNHAMLAKTYQIERAKPVTVLLGSSHVHIGVDADDPAWPASMRPVYNYAIPGWYSDTTSLLGLRQAAALGQLKYAVIFLDFQNYLEPDPPAGGPDEAERRLLVRANGTANPARPAQVASDFFLSLFTIGAVLDSAKTVLAQHGDVVLDLLPDGSATEADFINAARVDGMHDLFAQKDVLETERARESVAAIAGWHGELPNLDTVVAAIRFCIDRGITLRLALAPNHVRALDLYWRDGLWPRIDQLKTELASLVAREGHGQVELWDFVDYNAYSTEPVPVEGDRRTPTQWFWESSHFKKQLGHRIILTMLHHGPADLGVLLTPENVAARNAAVRAHIETYHCRQDGLSDATCAQAHEGPAERADNQAGN